MRRLTIRAEPELIERAKHRARIRGVSVSQVVCDAIRSYLEDAEDEERIPPPLTCVGAFESGRSDLSRLASEDIFEPEPWRTSAESAAGAS